MDMLNDKYPGPQQDNTTGTFFQNKPADLIEEVIYVNQHVWIAYLLLLLLFGFAVIYYAFPDRLSLLTSHLKVNRQSRQTQKVISGPGIFIYTFFLVNYLIAVSLFLYFLLPHLSFIQKSVLIESVFLIAAFVLIYYIYRIGLISFLGFIFNTKDEAILQQNLSSGTDFLLGILLIPVLLFSIYVQNSIPIIAGIILILIVHIFRWFQTFLLSRSISGISGIHIIVYLCTLEIVPLLVMIKAVQTF